MTPEILIPLLFLLGAFGCLLSGYPVAFGLGGMSVVVLGALVGLSILGVEIQGANGWPLIDASSWRDLSPLADKVYQLMAPSGQTLLAIPLFILMGVLLHRSGLAEQLFEAVQSLVSRLPGGLGASVVMVGGLLAASTGVVGASVVTLTAIALPALVAQGYGPRRAAGIVTASGTLGQIIPPSIILILLAEQVGAQFQAAQIAQGDFTPMAVTSGDLFRSALLPGILVLIGFAVLASLQGWTIKPERQTWPKQGKQAAGLKLSPLGLLGRIVPPVGLIVLVLGSILAGVTDTTSAASFGAVGALVLASRDGRLIWPGLVCAVALFTWHLLGASEALRPVGLGLYLGLLGVIGWSGVLTLRRGILAAATFDMLRLSAMIYAIIIGAGLFALTFKALGGQDVMTQAFHALTTATGANDPAQAAHLALLYLLIIIFLLGFVLEFIEIIVVVLPLALPVVFSVPADVLDPIWAGILIALTLQTSFLTPPFGVALFYFRGAAPQHGTALQLYIGVLPFIGVQVLVILMVWFFPALI